METNSVLIENDAHYIATIRARLKEEQWRLDRRFTDPELTILAGMCAESENPQKDLEEALKILGINDISIEEYRRRAIQRGTH